MDTSIELPPPISKEMMGKLIKKYGEPISDVEEVRAKLLMTGRRHAPDMTPEMFDDYWREIFLPMLEHGCMAMFNYKDAHFVVLSDDTAFRPPETTDET